MNDGHIAFPVIGAKWAIGVTGLLHTTVGALAIGLAFVVTVAQIVAYVRRDNRYDMLAKKVQLIHVCIYNIGTIVAIGLVFCLSGLFPQFWSQLFVHLFWTLIVEEFLFFLLATTLTFHYFFWDNMWGHKKLHIFLGALMNPLFLLQFFIINGIGAYMLTPGMREGQADLFKGIQGWDIAAFYNPSLLMLTLHRLLANISYAGFIVAAVCGVSLYSAKRPKIRQYHIDSGRLAFYIAFIAFLSLPIIGYFYAHVLKYYANEAYVNLMWGRGDVVAGGIDWWWLKHVFVVGMLGMSLAYFHRFEDKKGAFALPKVMVWSVAIFYLMYYISMGSIMTWTFFWVMLGCGVGGAILARHLLDYHEGNPRAVFILMGISAAMTVLLGGYVREASRPRFVNRIAHYDSVYKPEQRAAYLMVDVDPADIPKAAPAPEPTEAVRLIRGNCAGCHTLQRMRAYRPQRADDWHVIVDQMRAYGMRLTHEQADAITEHLKSGKPY